MAELRICISIQNDSSLIYLNQVMLLEYYIRLFKHIISYKYSHVDMYLP